jgi:hypothetical protein
LMRDKMAVEEGGKVHRLWDLCGEYFNYVSEKIIPMHHRFSAPPSSSCRMKRHPPSFHHLPQARGQCNMNLMLHVFSKLTCSKEAEKSLDC